MGRARGSNAFGSPPRGGIGKDVTAEDYEAMRVLAVWCDDYTLGLLEVGDYADDIFDLGLLISEEESTVLTTRGEAVIEQALERGLVERSHAFRLLLSVYDGRDGDNEKAVCEDIAAGLLQEVDEDGSLAFTDTGITLAAAALQPFLDTD
jgi:hypothetical protein